MNEAEIAQLQKNADRFIELFNQSFGVFYLNSDSIDTDKIFSVTILAEDTVIGGFVDAKQIKVECAELCLKLPPLYIGLESDIENQFIEFRMNLIRILVAGSYKKGVKDTQKKITTVLGLQ